MAKNGNYARQNKEQRQKSQSKKQMEFPILSECSVFVFDCTIKEIHRAMVANRSCDEIYANIQNVITLLIYMKNVRGENTIRLINEFNKCLHAIKVNDRHRIHNIVRDMHYKCMIMEAEEDDNTDEEEWVHDKQLE